MEIRKLYENAVRENVRPDFLGNWIYEKFLESGEKFEDFEVDKAVFDVLQMMLDNGDVDGFFVHSAMEIEIDGMGGLLFFYDENHNLQINEDELGKLRESIKLLEKFVEKNEVELIPFWENAYRELVEAAA